LVIKTNFLINALWIRSRSCETHTEHLILLFGEGGGLLKGKRGGTHSNHQVLESRVIFRAISPRVSCGGQSDTGGGFSSINSVSPVREFY